MKTILTLIILAGGCASALAATASSVLASVNSSQKLVSVTYTLSGAGAFGATVRMDASTNGGASWDIPVITTDGDIGRDIMDGAGKQIVWNAGKDWPDKESSNMVVRLLADTQTTNGNPMQAHYPGCRIPVTGYTTDLLWLDNCDGKLQLGRPFSFADNGNGTVTDNNTGLMWVKDLTGPAGNNGTLMTYWEATNWIETLAYAGYDDWRMADYYEVAMLTDYGKGAYDCLPGWMVHTKRRAYWVEGAGRGYCSTYFDAGYIDYLKRDRSPQSITIRSTSVTNRTTLNVMLVRGADLTIPVYVGAANLWKDSNNHLQWGVVPTNINNEIGCAYG